MSLELAQPTIPEQFEAIIQTEDKLQIKDFLNHQNISDVAMLVDEFPDYESQIIANMSVHRAASVFKILDLSVQKRIIRDLPPNTIASLLNELPADDRTDFLEELPSNAVRELIKLLDPEERKITLSLLGYPENSIGRLMTPDYVYVYPDNTIEEVFATIRKYGKDSETINVIYVINKKGELLDDIRIRDFILNPPDKKVAELMDNRVVSLKADEDQETAGEVFKMNNRVALPVVSNSNKLLGIVTIDDMLWVAEEEFSEDMQKMGGTAALNEPYLDIPIFKLFKKKSGMADCVVPRRIINGLCYGLFRGRNTESCGTGLVCAPDHFQRWQQRVTGFHPDHTGNGHWGNNHQGLVESYAQGNHFGPAAWIRISHYRLFKNLDLALSRPGIIWRPLVCHRLHRRYHFTGSSSLGNSCRQHASNGLETTGS